jgi:hypothetical protein
MTHKSPVNEIRLGSIRAAIWENHSGQDAVWFNVTLSRIYSQGNAWKRTTAFRRDDLPIAAKALEIAYAWILDRQATSQQRAGGEQGRVITATE